VEAPDAVRVEDVPRQMDAGEAVAEITALGFMDTVTVVEPVHPAASVPVTEYVVIADGDTLTVVPFRDPGIHT